MLLCLFANNLTCVQTMPSKLWSGWVQTPTEKPW